MNNKYISKIIIGAMLLMNLFVFSPAYAVNCGNNDLTYDTQTGLCVPAGQKDLSVNDFIIKVINVLLSVAAAIAVLFIIIGGFMYVTSAGNAEQAEKGRTTLVNAVIGLIIIILAYVIVGVVNNIFGGNGLFSGLFGL